MDRKRPRGREVPCRGFHTPGSFRHIQGLRDLRTRKLARLPELDTLTLERREIDGEWVWVLRAPKPDWSWLGALRGYARGKSHEWEDIERSIDRGWAGDDRP